MRHAVSASKKAASLHGLQPRSKSGLRSVNLSSFCCIRARLAVMMLLLRSSLALSANRSARELQYAVHSYLLFACVAPHTRSLIKIVQLQHF